MLNQTSQKFRKFFLLEFTKEIIRSHDKYKELRIKSEVKKVLFKENLKKEIPKSMTISELIRERVHDKIKRDSRRISPLKNNYLENLKKQEKEDKKLDIKTYEKSLLPKNAEFNFPVSNQNRIMISEIRKKNIPLKIPDFNFPETVRHIRPIPSREQIDLGKLNDLIRDPSVKTVECNGPNQKIIVTGIMGRKNTPITLDKEEIDDIIHKFSEISRIPLHEGFFRVAVGKLLITAIISQIIDSTFIIKKILPNEIQTHRMPPNRILSFER